MLLFHKCIVKYIGQHNIQNSGLMTLQFELNRLAKLIGLTEFIKHYDIIKLVELTQDPWEYFA